MTHLLATTDSTGAGGFLIILLLLALSFVVVTIVAMWKMFEKANKPGWAAIVPVYNLWVMAEIVGWPGWYGLFPFLAIIPILGYIAVVIIQIVLAVKLAEAFGRGGGMAVVLILFAPIGYMILGFGDARHQDSAGGW